MSVQEPPNRDIVLFALYELGGANRPIHTEDVAHRVFQYPIGRQRYRWERYAMHPDKERVARELRRLKNARGSVFVKGHVNIGAKKDRIDGWMLTSEGVDRVKSMENQLAAAVGAAAGSHSIYKAEDLQRRVTSTECYKIYLSDPSLSQANDHDLTDMLYCLPDATTKKIRSVFDELLADAKAVGAAEVLAFLEAARSRFHHLLEK